MRRAILGVGIGLLLVFAGRYCIKNGDEEKVVQALQNYNKIDDVKEDNLEKNEKGSIDSNNVLESIKGIWGTGVMYSYKLDSKPTEKNMEKYSGLAKKNIIISDHRYFNIFDSIYYDKNFKEPYYRISKVDGKIIDYNDKNLYIMKPALLGLDTEGPVYKVVVTDEEHKNDDNYKDTPVFYTNGNILIINYEGCSFRYTKLN
ncbi:hypothetical protein K5V21_07115 [Clostridium sardiniense]|uniref:Lipoprotein n=1 Tax=Clostridium sardiniense TaxID=29369 RepID=A0ABS7KXC3_CLOSR|nr:hypothetical protein [Clostridium sardiniense]MBY0755222.1 hypothetical protein [Clostridium sardiniense]MDQ0459665.1 hypothetical protein [Clostridium sardiniense]